MTAQRLTRCSRGLAYFEPMLRRVVENCDAAPACVTADAGYFSDDNVRAAEALGAEPNIAVGAHRRDGRLDEERALPGVQTEQRQQMRSRLEVDEGRAAYARRKATVEPVFGNSAHAMGSARCLSAASGRVDANGC